MKKIVIAVLVLLALGAGLWLGRSPYKKWKQNRFVSQARGFLAKGDSRSAAFSARKALEVNFSNVDATRIMAQVTEQARLPQSISWRARLVELQPGGASNRLDLARTAILFGKLARADQALRGIPEADRDTVDFHIMSAYVAIRQNDLAAAETHCARAVKLDPQNKGAQLNLALVRLQSRDRQIVGAARESLEPLCLDPGTRRDALRGLAEDALRNDDITRALNFSRQLQAEKPADFTDSLMYLSVLKQAKSPELAAYLLALEKTAPENPHHLNELALWFRGHRMPDEALNWLLSLPAKTQADQLTTELIADCYADLHEWRKMQAVLEDKKWGQFEFVRLAKLSRAFREQKQDLKAQADWHSAVIAAAGKLTPLSALLGLAEAWGWTKEKEEVAWLIVQRYPGERRVLGMLDQLYVSTGNTRGLQKVSATKVGFNADDVAARNNFAAISLLLNLDLDRAREMARENYNRRPEDPVIASTYAYSLHLQGQTQAGLQLLEKFKPEELQQPAVATYYGVMLAATGQSTKAKKYLDIAGRSPLLPEEKLLVMAALKNHASQN